MCVCVVRKASREAPPPIYNFQRCRRAQFHGSVQEINHLPTSFLLKKEENLNSKIRDRMDYKCQQYSVKTSNLCWLVSLLIAFIGGGDGGDQGGVDGDGGGSGGDGGDCVGGGGGGDDGDSQSLRKAEETAAQWVIRHRRWLPVFQQPSFKFTCTKSQRIQASQSNQIDVTSLIHFFLSLMNY